MVESREPRLSIARGLRGAAIGGFAAAALTVVLWAVFYQRGFDLRAARDELIGPILGITAIGGCAGWAAFAPAGRHPFARSFAIVFLGSLPLWAILGSLELTPRRHRGFNHPAIYPSEALLLVSAPVVMAAILTLARVWPGGRSAKPGAASVAGANQPLDTPGG